METMTMESIQCPSCGNSNIEWQEDGYQCVSCGRKFGMSEQMLEDEIEHTRQIHFSEGAGMCYDCSITITRDICELKYRNEDYSVVVYDKIDSRSYEYLLESIYNEAFVNDWRESYKTEEMLTDGLSWTLRLDYEEVYSASGNAAGRRPRVISGYGLFPPQYKKLTQLFEHFFWSSYIPYNKSELSPSQKLCLAFLSCMNYGDLSALESQKEWSPAMLVKQPEIYLFLLKQASFCGKHAFTHYLLEYYAKTPELAAAVKDSLG